MEKSSYLLFMLENNPSLKKKVNDFNYFYALEDYHHIFILRQALSTSRLAYPNKFNQIQ